MAVQINKVITDNFGRIFPDWEHHWMGFGLEVAGAASGTYQVDISLNGGTSWVGWFDMMTASTPENNKAGYFIQFSFTQGTYPIRVRDKQFPSDVANGSVTLAYNNLVKTKMAEADTPIIVTSALTNAPGQVIRVDTRVPGSLVRLYKSEDYFNGTANVHGFLRQTEPIVSGVSDVNGFIDLPAYGNTAAVAPSYVATAQTIDQLESYPSNQIKVGGPKGMQLRPWYTYGAATATGRMITINSVDGGSGTYSFTRLNDGNWPYVIGVPFEIPFGYSNILVTSTAFTADEQPVGFIVYGGEPVATATSTTVNLRGDFSTTLNPNGKWRYGKLTKGPTGGPRTFTPFSIFGTYDGRASWGQNNLPQVGIEENQSFVLDADKVLMHPSLDDLLEAAVELTIADSGRYDLTITSKRVGPVVHPYTGATGLTSKISIYHRSGTSFNLIAEITHVVQNNLQTYNLVNRVLQNGDSLYITSDGNQQGAYAHNHVGITGTFTPTNTAPSVPLPPAPAVTITSAAVGATYSGTSPLGDTIGVYRNGYIVGFAWQDTVVGGNFNWKFAFPVAGNYTFRTFRNRISSTDSNTIAVTASVTAPAAPTVSVSTSSGTTPIPGTAVAAGTINVYKNGSLVPNTNVTADSTAAHAWSYTPPLDSTVAIYTFTITTPSGTSVPSSSVTVTPPTSGVKSITLSVATDTCNTTKTYAILSGLVTVDTGAVYQTSPVFSITPGDYTSFVKDAANSSNVSVKRWNFNGTIFTALA